MLNHIPRLTVSAFFLLACLAAENASANPIVRYLGICDASAAESLSNDLFVIANDEDNLLRIYSRAAPSAPPKYIDLTSFLQVTGSHSESDIEGAANIGARIHWITSHGANKEGKARPNRRRFFASEIVRQDGHISLVPIGAPYNRLLEEMAGAPALKPYALIESANTAPESEGGLNIEGLAATPEGQLLIAFRNPIPQGNALIVPLKNPDKVVNNGVPEFGEPIVLDLDGRGIRSLEYVPNRNGYLLVAGSRDDQKRFAIYEWPGPGSIKVTPLSNVAPTAFNPEALFPVGGSKSLQLLSDDGGELVGSMACKDSNTKSFRSVDIDL